MSFCVTANLANHWQGKVVWPKRSEGLTAFPCPSEFALLVIYFIHANALADLVHLHIQPYHLPYQSHWDEVLEPSTH